MNTDQALAVAQDTSEEQTSTSETTDTTVDVVCGNSGELCETLYEWTENQAFAETASFLIGTPVKIALILIGALILNRFARKWIGRTVSRMGTVSADHGESLMDERSVARAEQRATTIGSLLRSMTTALIFGASLILCLETVGVGVTALIASAGILSLAIGFGAQSLVEDMLRGVFMLGEDQFGVGDRIDVGVVNGEVERVTLRTAVIRDPDGTLWHVPNSEINWVANENQAHSRATIEIGVSYAADLTQALEALQGAVDRAVAEPEWREMVDGDPVVQGVQELGDDAVMIRVVVWVDAGERRRFERHLRRRLKDALDEANIEMPNRQVDVWLRDSTVAA
ncbi:MAG: mechanosensitive ion channel family protein [Acidimicrobiales bacterium]